MRRFIILFLTGLTMVLIVPSLIASSLITPEDLTFIDRFIMWLDNLDLDGLHVTLSTIVTLLLILLRLFQKKIKKTLR